MGDFLAFLGIRDIQTFYEIEASIYRRDAGRTATGSVENTGGNHGSQLTSTVQEPSPTPQPTRTPTTTGNQPTSATTPTTTGSGSSERDGLGKGSGNATSDGGNDKDTISIGNANIWKSSVGSENIPFEYRFNIGDRDPLDLNARKPQIVLRVVFEKPPAQIGLPARVVSVTYLGINSQTRLPRYRFKFQTPPVNYNVSATANPIIVTAGSMLETDCDWNPAWIAR